LSYGITQYIICHPTEVILTPLPPPQRIAGTHLSTRKDERLSRPWWLVIPRCFTRRRSPIQVLTGNDVG